MSERLLQELKKQATKKQLVELQIQTQNLDEASQTLSAKRKSLRLEREKVKKQRVIIKRKWHDNTVIPGRSGTLGSQPLVLGDTIKVTDARSRYFSILSKNIIVDVSESDEGSQLARLGLKTNCKIVTKLNDGVPSCGDVGFKHIVSLEKIWSTKSAKASCEQVAAFVPKNEGDRALKNVLHHILDIHAYQSFKLSDMYISKCTEQSLIVKYWSPLFESWFGYDEKYFLQWGDSLSQHTNMIAQDMRLDLRILVTNAERSVMESATGEFASPQSDNASKRYKDRLKSVLVSKVHLDHLVSTVKYIKPSEVKSIKVPIVQVMGLSCLISCISLADKGVYRVEDIYEFVYPQSYSHLKNGYVQKVINGLTILKDMIDALQTLERNFTKAGNNEIKRVSGAKTKGKKVAAINAEEWKSPLVLPSDTESDEHSGDEHSEEEHSEDDSTSEADEHSNIGSH